MDPCPFVRLIVESLALKLPHAATRPAAQDQELPLANSPHASLHVSKRRPTGVLHVRVGLPPRRRLSPPPFEQTHHPPSVRLRGPHGSTCGVSSGKLLGRLNVIIDLAGADSKSIVFRNGWLKLGREPDKPSPRIHLTVRSEPDPRFVFQFGGEPECSPVVFQIQGNIRQPVFSCKFSADRNSRSRCLPSDFTNNNGSSRGWMRTFSGDRERSGRERKGWMIMIYDLSGSPVAAASMITPFVPSPGSDRVSRSNPGAWLILRPNGFSVSSWKPWGRLEAWRERGAVDGLGYKFELVTDSTGPNSRISIAEATLSVKKGGKFCIDSRITRESLLNSRSPVKGFVMGSTVEGEGKVSKPVVEVGVQHVTCMADAALFIALSAAIDLSMDACRLFSHKLRKELCHDEQDYSFS
ncbi:hypothetical protein CICLE_v10008480mg [Citrus x clementina]|uniref:DUF1005 domain-containing protein n=1 Tax=Citrus clementina TaxID=85681 RepID=V4UQ34_CITCL|nr:hypothetical protein CICLE_v10008480mg [Citrus x clementina]